MEQNDLELTIKQVPADITWHFQYWKLHEYVYKHSFNWIYWFIQLGVKLLPFYVYLGMLNVLFCFAPARLTHLVVEARPQCVTHPDCRNTEQCHTGSCIDACRIEQCGVNAICSAQQHAATCTCPPGYTGDARRACYPSKYCNCTTSKSFRVLFSQLH